MSRICKIPNDSRKRMAKIAEPITFMPSAKPKKYPIKIPLLCSDSLNLNRSFVGAKGMYANTSNCLIYGIELMVIQFIYFSFHFFFF